MKRRAFALLIALCSLTGCQQTYAYDVFPNPDDPTLAYLTRNGDNFGKQGHNYPYQSVCRPFLKERLEEGLANERATMLFLYGDTCSHCEQAHNDLVDFFVGSGVEVEGVRFNAETQAQYVADLNAFGAAHPTLGRTLSSPYYTPTLFIIKNEEKILSLQFQNHRDSLQTLFDFFKEIINFTWVFNFHTYDSFVSFYQQNDCLVYCDEPAEEAPTTFFQDFYPVAIHSNKKTAHIEWEYVSEEDRNRFNELLPSTVSLAKKGELSPVPSSDITSSWINNYYA